MQIDIGVVTLIIVIAIAAILVIGLASLGLVRLSARRRQRFLGHAATERPYRPVNLLGAPDHKDTELPGSSTEGDR